MSARLLQSCTTSAAGAPVLVTNSNLRAVRDNVLVLVDGEAESLGLQVDLDQVGQARVLGRVIEARLRARF